MSVYLHSREAPGVTVSYPLFSVACPPPALYFFHQFYALCPQLKQAGTMCRGAAGACDLPEYCTGGAPYCPSNVYLLDGSLCQHGHAYCYNGMCLTHEQQCLQLWGYGKMRTVWLCL